MKLAAKKSSTRLLLFLFFFDAVLAPAQTIPAGTFKHIIIIVQENRTPDNLFGSAPAQARCGVEDPFEVGVDIENGGNGYVWDGHQNNLQLICLTPKPLDGGYNNGTYNDPDHYYAGWGLDYHGGLMDGFCHEYDNNNYIGICPSYSYVQRSDVQPILTSPRITDLQIIFSRQIKGRAFRHTSSCSREPRHRSHLGTPTITTWISWRTTVAGTADAPTPARCGRGGSYRTALPRPTRGNLSATPTTAWSPVPTV